MSMRTSHKLLRFNFYRIALQNYHNREDFVARASCLLGLQTESLRYALLCITYRRS